MISEHPDHFLERFESEQTRRLRIAIALRALRGSVPPFTDSADRRLRDAMRQGVVETPPSVRCPETAISAP